ncbi:hypothetical protein [Bradyrhizobium oropedii]|uniref:hypothetical protein n=1 Tax=Bradyrhizobium oropedii TaxID=1571201 RepID=UPI001E50C5F0|nr:hypothetical protein [Bradyrhizobium oropedii]
MSARVVARFQKIDPVALTRAVCEVEMFGVLLPHHRGALFPAGGHLGAALDGHAVVQTEVALLLAHRAPVQRGKQRCHPCLFRSHRIATTAGNVLQHKEREDIGATAHG